MTRTRTMSRLIAAKKSALGALLLALLVVSACSADSDLTEISCDSENDCPDQATCIEGYCVEQQLDGSLEVTIDGLPEILEADVRIEGPQEFETTVVESTTLEALEPGDYQVHAQPAGGQIRYLPEPSTVEVTVQAEQSAQVFIEYDVVPGGLDISFDGLPEGHDGVAQIEGPQGFSETITGEQSFDELIPGTYELSPESVVTAQGVFEAPATEVDVLSDEMAEATVSYEVVLGSIQVNTEGLPQGAEPTIEIVDQQAQVVHQVSGGGLIEDVQPGFYTAMPEIFEESGTLYIASEADVTVESGETAEVTLQYLVDPGALTVNVQGLPEAVNHSMRLVDGQSSIELPQSGELAAVEPGDYTLEIDDVEDGIATYEAADQSVTIISGETTDVDVIFEVIPAQLTVTVTGLPDGVDPDVDLAGEGFNTNISDENSTFDSLVPGDYTITPNPVPVGDNLYEASGQSITLASDDEESVEIQYQITNGGVQVSVIGLEGHTATVELYSEGGDFIDDLDIQDGSNEVFADLEPGNYSVQPLDVVQSPKTYEADPISNIAVNSEDDTPVTVQYDFIRGDLFISANGLDGLSLEAEIEGPEYGSPHPVTGEQTLQNIEPGDYTVTYQRVLDSDGNYYDPDPVVEGPLTVSSGDSGQDVSAVGQYELVDGTVEIAVSGLEGNTADVEIVGQDSDTLTFNGDDTLQSSGLTPGIYSIDPETIDVDMSGGAWTATYEPGSVDDVEVNSGQTATESVTYSLVPGNLTVDATGLDGLDIEIEIEGPEYSGTAALSGNPIEQNNIEPGQYDITFLEVTNDIGNGNTESYLVDPDQDTVFVSSDDTTETTGNYELQSGDLTVDVELPDGVSAQFIVEGVDNGFSDSFSVTGGAIHSESFTIDPGRYQVVLQDPVVDEWDNEFQFEGLETPIDISSDDNLSHSVSAPLPTVVTNGNDAGQGSLRGVVNYVNATSEITFEAGVSSIQLDSGEITIDKPLVIDGEGAGVVIDGGNAMRIFELVLSGTGDDVVHLQDLTLQSGSANTGGAIQVDVDDVEVSLVGLDFKDNVATGAGGGAIYVANTGDEGFLEVYDSSFSGNQAESGDGGAVFVDNGAGFTAEFVEFFSNDADGDGGALYGGDIRLRSALLSGNTATDGAAIYLNDQSMDSEVTRSLFVQNHAGGHGGGVYVEARLTLRNSTFSENHADGDGGALYFGTDSTARINYVTMVENVATEGPAIRSVATAADGAADVEMIGSYLGNTGAPSNQTSKIVADDEGANDAAVQSGGYNFITTVGNDDFDEVGSDIIGDEAQYEPLADHGGFTDVHRIEPQSPGYGDIPASECLELSTTTPSLMSEDQRESPRPSGAFCTRGAWEIDAQMEGFDDDEFPEAPGSGTFAGLVDWDYDSVQESGSFSIDGPGALLSGDTAWIETAGIDVSSIDSLSIQYRKAGDSDEDRQIRVFAGGDEVAISAVFGDATGADSTVYVLEIDDWDGADGNLRIENEEDGDVTIDNISWR